MNANKQDAGGLPELPETMFVMRDEETPAYSEDHMRAYGEQCRAASVASGEAEELAAKLDGDFASDRVDWDNVSDAARLLRALSRGVSEDTKRMDWLAANVTETLTAKSIQGEFPHPEHKTQYVLPRLIAWADFHGQVGFREAIDYAIAAKREEA